MYSQTVVFAKQTPSAPHRGPDHPIKVYLVITAGWFFYIAPIYVCLYVVSDSVVRYYTEKQLYVQFQSPTHYSDHKND